MFHSSAVAQYVQTESMPSNHNRQSTCLRTEIELVDTAYQPIQAVLHVVAVFDATTIACDGSVLGVEPWLRGEEYTPAHWAGVVVAEPGGDAVGADEVVAWGADQAFDDTGFGGRAAAFFEALNPRLVLLFAR